MMHTCGAADAGWVLHTTHMTKLNSSESQGNFLGLAQRYNTLSFQTKLIVNSFFSFSSLSQFVTEEICSLECD